MKGIILAGGSGTRLDPLTRSTSKQLLPVYDKPAIYYPLSILMLAGIKEILIISTPRDVPRIEEMLGDGRQFGLHVSYKIQEEPKGISEAFILGESFINSEPVCLVLGDNLFFGHKLGDILSQAAKLEEGAEVFAFHVNNPQEFGIVDFDQNGVALSIEEKPDKPKSNWAVTGLYFYDGHVSEMAKKLEPSARGELEITDLNKMYLNEGRLKVSTLGRGMAWLDIGTHDSLIQSSMFVQMIEKRQGLKVGCPEEVAYVKGFIDENHLQNLIDSYPKSPYREYLKDLLHFGPL